MQEGGAFKHPCASCADRRGRGGLAVPILSPVVRLRGHRPASLGEPSRWPRRHVLVEQSPSPLTQLLFLFPQELAHME